jgi:hypothetical protein
MPSAVKIALHTAGARAGIRRRVLVSTTPAGVMGCQTGTRHAAPLEGNHVGTLLIRGRVAEAVDAQSEPQFAGG